MGPRRGPRLAFISCNETPWGGSEELWARAALACVEKGAQVAFAKPRMPPSVPVIRDLTRVSLLATDLFRIPLVPMRLANFLNFLARPVSFAYHLLALWIFILRARPELIILSQGGCWDGFYMRRVLRLFSIPYVLICQKASDLYWPPDRLRGEVRDFVLSARHVFTVSQHNLDLLQEQIGCAVNSASVVRNPFLVDYNEPLPWPEVGDGVRLACVGRLHTMEKGQDMLLRVLARPGWKARDIHVDFYGEGVNREGLEEMAAFLDCRNVTFRGHVHDITAIWRDHHALILPSRAEGLPLVLVETMLAGRVAIVSAAGGSAEVVEDGETAFLVRGFDEAALDAAMERAWQRRNEWPSMAKKAAAAIRLSVPGDPAEELASRLLELHGAEGAVRNSERGA